MPKEPEGHPRDLPGLPRHEQWAVMVHNTNKWISIGKAEAFCPDGKGYHDWYVVADDFSESDAERYVKLNWRDRYFTAYPQAVEDRKRGMYPYQDLNDEEFEALFYRMTKEEYLEAAVPERKKEEEEKAKELAAKREEARVTMIDCTGFKVLYLYGYGTSETLVKNGPLKELQKGLKGAQFDVLEGWHRLSKRSEFANIEDNHPELVKMSLQEGVPTFCYAPIEVPPRSEDDFTALLCKAQNIKFAKPALEDVEKAMDKIIEHIVEQGGYDMIMGFSCGGEIVSMLVGRLSEINKRAERPTKAITLMGTRCLYKKYGEPLDNVPVGIKACIMHGHEDDEERPPFTEDNYWDLKEFESKFKAAGMDVLTIKFDGVHETPIHMPTQDPVYVQWKAWLEPILPKKGNAKPPEPEVPLD